MKTTTIAFILAVCFVATGLAVEVKVGALGFYGSFAGANDLIEVFEADNGLALPEIHAGWGLRLDAPLWSPMEKVRVGLGFMGMGARTSSRDIAAEASLLGLFGWAEYQLGRLSAAIDVGGYRGTFSFPPARYVDLSGWSAGIVGRVRYEGISLGRFSLGSTLSLQWLPIQQMSDKGGQKYRGRGTPFMDFSGISLSIDLGWHSGKE